MGEDGCVHLDGILTFKSVPALYRQTEELFNGHTPASSFDLSKVTAIDSSGLALLLEWQATRERSTRILQIRNAPPSLVSLARLCEADDLMDITGRGRKV